jgi:hypothetical protein
MNAVEIEEAVSALAERPVTAHIPAILGRNGRMLTMRSSGPKATSTACS